MAVMNKSSGIAGLFSNPPQSKEDFVYETLREAILSGQLKPGEELVHTDIARQLGISHIPIRAAIQRLAAEELVDLETHRSPKVSELSPEGINEALLVRMYLETLAARESFPRISHDDLKNLWRLVEEMDEALAEQKFHQFGALNKVFHLTLYEPCPVALLKRMIVDLWNNTDRHRSRAIFSLDPDLAKKSQQDHVEILKLIEANAFEQAVTLLEAHKTRARKTFLASTTKKQSGVAVESEGNV
jgi:DNA-binding GntR family transcriptional regulator